MGLKVYEVPMLTKVDYNNLKSLIMGLKVYVSFIFMCVCVCVFVCMYVCMYVCISNVCEARVSQTARMQTKLD